MGEAEEVYRADSRQKIVTVMNDVTKCPEPVSPQELATLCDMKDDLVRQTLGRMVTNAEIIRVSHGRYISAARPDLRQCIPVTKSQRHNDRQSDKVTTFLFSLSLSLSLSLGGYRDTDTYRKQAKAVMERVFCGSDM